MWEETQQAAVWREQVGAEPNDAVVRHVSATNTHRRQRHEAPQNLAIQSGRVCVYVCVAAGERLLSL